MDNPPLITSYLRLESCGVFTRWKEAQQFGRYRILIPGKSCSVVLELIKGNHPGQGTGSPSSLMQALTFWAEQPIVAPLTPSGFSSLCVIQAC